MKLDQTSKAMLIVLGVLVAYMLALGMINTLFAGEKYGDTLMDFSTGGNRVKNLLSLAIGLASGLAISLGLQEKTQERRKRPDGELGATKKVLSKDERKIVEEIEKSEEITQDSLRFRLGWSKAKVSAVASALDRLDVVQRQREGKTYLLKLSKRFRTVKQTEKI
jgi:uncharacterized membrane protein